MSESEFVELLQECVEASDSDLSEEVRSSGTFNDAGLLTMNEGLVVRLDDGSEFQVTVVKSR